MAIKDTEGFARCSIFIRFFILYQVSLLFSSAFIPSTRPLNYPYKALFALGNTFWTISRGHRYFPFPPVHAFTFVTHTCRAQHSHFSAFYSSHLRKQGHIKTYTYQ